MADKFRGTIEQLKEAVAAAGISGAWREESDGWHRYDAVNEGILKWWPSTGSLAFQGPETGRSYLQAGVMAALADGKESKELLKKANPDKRIFIVHGHDIKVLERLELILRRLGLEPYMLIKDAGTAAR